MQQGRRRVFCIGIGGIGLSALAQWLRADGNLVQGADRVPSEVARGLKACGIPVAVNEGTTLPTDTDLLVSSAAVPADHQMRVAARARGIPDRTYAEMLGELTTATTLLAASGSHGKSTTTALAGLFLEAAGRNPTVVVGARVPAWQRGAAPGNFRAGDGRLSVVEADEYAGHFRTLAPTVAVVTSLDHDHVDYFPTPEAYRAAFATFLKRVRPGGHVVLPAGEAAAADLRSPPSVTVTTFGAHPTAADVCARPRLAGPPKQTFGLTVRGADWGEFSLRVPGTHMLENVAAAVAAVLPFGVTAASVRQVLEVFQGTARRFEHVGFFGGSPVISDYAHHPTELRALARAARDWYRGSGLVLVFQPHQHARSRAFASAFRDALRAFDHVLLTAVYDVAGREGTDRVDTLEWVADLVRRGTPAVHVPVLADLPETLREVVTARDVLLIAGAGDIDSVAREIVSRRS